MNRVILVLFCVLFCVVVCLPSPAMALESEEKKHKLDEVVVTSTSELKVVETPASLSIITAEELEAMGAKNIVEALARIPGVDDSSTKGRSVTIRGNKSAMAGGPLIFIDGIPQKVGDYQYAEFNFIPVSQVERIEVLRSAGIAAGPGAARGVINVITKKSGENGVHGNVGASYGSWNTHDTHASVYGRSNRWDYLANAGFYHTDGFEEEEENRLSMLGKLGYNLSDHTRIGVKANHIDYDQDTVEGFSKKEWQLANYYTDIHFPKSETDPDLIWHNEREQAHTTVALEASHRQSRLFLDSALSWTNYDETFKRLKDLYDNPTGIYHEDTQQDTYTFSLSGGYHFDIGTSSYTPSLGVSYEQIDGTVDRQYPNDPDKDTSKYDFDLNSVQYGIFWDNDLLFENRWGLKIGGRVDQAQIELEDKVPNTVDESETMFSYQIAPSYRLSDKANIYASAGRNYWFPTPRYYAWAQERGGDLNRPEDLKPEEVMTWELGYKHMLHKAFNINATLYYAEYKDKFGSVYEGTTSRGQGNIGDAEARGIELEVDGRLTDWVGYRVAGAYQNIEWTSGTAYVYTHPDNTIDRQADVSGKQIYWVPEISGVIGLDFYPAQKLKCSVDVNYTGKRYVDYLNRIDYPAKTTFDANISYTWQQWKFWLLGKNVLGEELEYVSNSSGRLTEAGGEPDNAYYVQDGAYFEVGAGFQF